MVTLTFYTAEWCPDCVAAKRVLDEKGLEYNLVDVDDQPDATDIIVAAKGKRVLPALEYKGHFIDGNRFNRERFEKELADLLAK